MNIVKIENDKKDYLDLLLLADEQEDMIDKYLDDGDMYILVDNGIKAECVIIKKKEGVYELKNIAVSPKYQGKGYGKALIDFLFSEYPDLKTMYVGTGDVPRTINFYKHCGFNESHRIENFFLDNYDHYIIEEDIILKDMVYLRRDVD